MVDVTLSYKTPHSSGDAFLLGCAGIRLSTFDAAKKVLNRSEKAYAEEVAKAQ